ncbi:MAG TPA: S8 family serine peptidase [Rhizobiaceae bacterium]|nr:S8 family serine peptidase [Rhizobiaceae bacterium]
METTAIPQEPQFTGRFLVVGKPHASKETLSTLRDAAGLDIASSRDFDEQAVTSEALEETDGVYFDEIGIAVISAQDAEQLDRVAAAESVGAAAGGPMLEPEQMMYALGEDFGDYLRGFRDAANALADRYERGAGSGGVAEAPFAPQDMTALVAGATWGLQKTRVVVSAPLVQDRTGKGIRVAVLDTGMDLNHPDFAGRAITSRSFISGEAVQDGHSHGTHCIGTACGPKAPAGVDRYGVAYEAEIFAGKVLSNGGSGADGGILGGINWAIANKCEIISMSLGSPVSINDGGFSQAYENAAQAALAAGTLIIAAAGNDSRFGLKPVGRPANCPSIMAVGAVDQNLARADFSNVTFHAPHGKVDIAGPGVGVFSSVPVAFGTHGSMSGTSMATPHVAGIAALHAQANAAHRGAALWQRLIATAEAIGGQPAGHVGAGLVQAPWRRAVPPRPWWWYWFNRHFQGQGDVPTAKATGAPRGKAGKSRKS